MNKSNNAEDLKTYYPLLYLPVALSKERSPLDKNPMPGHLYELQPVNAVKTKGQSFRASFGKTPRFQIQLTP